MAEVSGVEFNVPTALVVIVALIVWCVVVCFVIWAVLKFAAKLFCGDPEAEGETL